MQHAHAIQHLCSVTLQSVNLSHNPTPSKQNMEESIFHVTPSMQHAIGFQSSPGCTQCHLLFPIVFVHISLAPWLLPCHALQHRSSPALTQSPGNVNQLPICHPHVMRHTSSHNPWPRSIGKHPRCLLLLWLPTTPNSAAAKSCGHLPCPTTESSSFSSCFHEAVQGLQA